MNFKLRNGGEVSDSRVRSIMRSLLDLNTQDPTVLPDLYAFLWDPEDHITKHTERMLEKAGLFVGGQVMDDVRLVMLSAWHNGKLHSPVDPPQYL